MNHEDSETSLEDVFGTVFAEQHKEQRRKSSQDRRRVSEADMRRIAYLAVNEERMSGYDPKFRFTSSDGVTQDVLLVSVPDPEDSFIDSMRSTRGGDGSVAFPLAYFNEWIWAWLDEERVEPLLPGEMYLVAGHLVNWEREDGSVSRSLSSVRGLASLETIQEWAEEAIGA